jgi:hypothetical protein
MPQPGAATSLEHGRPTDPNQQTAENTKSIAETNKETLEHIRQLADEGRWRAVLIQAQRAPMQSFMTRNGWAK